MRWMEAWSVMCLGMVGSKMIGNYCCHAKILPAHWEC